MAISQPVRRSRRGLGAPLTTVTAGPSRTTTGLPVHLRPTNAGLDLELEQFEELEREEVDVESLETRFYASLSTGSGEGTSGIKRAKKVYGKQKASVDELRVGDTVLVNAMNNKPSVCVLVSIWKVYDGDEEKWTNLRVHWFSREADLPRHRSQRDILQNEVFYQLDTTSIVPPSAVVGHCTVLAQPTPDWAPDENTFVCVNAIYPRKNYYYEFNWDAFRKSALSLTSTATPSSSTQPIETDIWEHTDHWDVIPGETPFTPKKPRDHAYKGRYGAHSGRLGAIAEESDDDPETHSPGKRKRARESLSPVKRTRETEEDDELPTLPKTPSKRGRGQSKGREHPSTTYREESIVPSSSEDEGDASEDYVLPFAPPSDDDEDKALHASDSEPSTPSEPEFEDINPRTPRKRKNRAGTVASTPRRQRGAHLAAPTPHSKAALRARARRRTLAVRPPPGLTSADDSALSTLPVDPWLRAMAVLHVAARPTEGGCLPCREGEYARVLTAVEELLDEGGGGCVYISGVPGTGKTATVHAVVRELKRMAEAGEANPFTYVEVNGLRIPEPQAAYGLLWEAVCGHDASREGHLKISPKEALKNLGRHFAQSAGPRGHACVVLMDELDQLMTTKQDVVYNFFNWPTLVGSKLIVLAVANTMDLPERVMSGRVRSRLGMVRINFQPYTTPQLEQIVRARLASAAAGLPIDTPTVVAPDGIKFAAMKVSSISGDARRVLDICRSAVERVAPARRPARADDVKIVVAAAQNSPTAAYVRALPFHARLLLAALLRVARREGVDEVRWGDVQHQHVLHAGVLGDDEEARRPSREELAAVREDLAAARALLCEDGPLAMRKHEDERRIVLNLDAGEVARVLGEVGGARWRNALNV